MSTLLAIDIGNTHTTVGVWRGETWLAELRLHTDGRRTSDELASVLLPRLERKLRAAAPGASPSGAMVCSVVPLATEPLVRMLREELALEVRVAGPELDEGIRRRTTPPESTGSDRVVNALAAHTLHRPDANVGCLVVDLGTATTFDVVSPGGELLGGAIAPGVEVAARALLGATAQLPRFDLQVPARALAATTAGALQTGVVMGHVALVDGLVRRLAAEAGFTVRVIATGGWAGRVAPASGTIEVVAARLTLDGLRLLWERNCVSRP